MSCTRLSDGSEVPAALAESPEQGEADSFGILSRAVVEHFRCPQGLLQLRATGSFESGEGRFFLGPDIACFGKWRSTEQGGDLPASPDLLSEVNVSGPILELPFDPTEVIDNLRLERYTESLGQNIVKSRRLLKETYYVLRPFLGLTIRKRIQKLHARNWRKRKFPQWPVDTTVEDLCERVLLLSLKASGLERMPFVWFWPSAKRGCVVMTHDVEDHAGLDFCEKLMDLDDRFGVKASFQIVPESRYVVSDRLLENIRRRGFEVGLQDLNHDGRLFDERQEFLRRAESINRYTKEYGARGFRAAVLYRKPEWLDALDISFDMSIPNVAHLDPQSGGCCTVSPYFIGDIVELPVTMVQDYTLFHIMGDYSIDLWKKQLDIVLRKNGLATFIVHPDYIAEAKARTVYTSLLQHLAAFRDSGTLWFALPQQVNDWWRARSEMRVEWDRGAWRIVGRNTDQAVLAFAKLSAKGTLEYEVDIPPTAN
jgi:hypothetical protein